MIPAPHEAPIHPVHPFPARMAPSIVWDFLPKTGRSLRVLDPMSGSGTTLVCARSRGHQATGCDTDPLALLIARAWCADIEPDNIMRRAGLVLERAAAVHDRRMDNEAYPNGIDGETRRFIDFWFDPENRRQLAALSACLSEVRSPKERTILWCAFSRMIITKTAGVSRAMDVSHSRPHRAYAIAPVKPFGAFLEAVSRVVRNCPFAGLANSPPAVDIRRGDARALPVESASVDLVITSPPYLNAIDYLRGHRLSLVWMGYNIEEIRAVRSGNIGTEVSMQSLPDEAVHRALSAVAIESLDRRHQGMVRRYFQDMNRVMNECARVLKRNGSAVFVVGNSAIRGVFIKNSEALIRIAEGNGLYLVSRDIHCIERRRRYLPPPESEGAGGKMQSRMREEAILEFRLD